MDMPSDSEPLATMTEPPQARRSGRWRFPAAVGLLILAARPAICGPDIGAPQPGTRSEISAQESASAFKDCGLSGNEIFIAQLLTSSLQKRHEIKCHPLLQRFAEHRAEDMASRGYLAHISPERLGPNQMLRDFGYSLPDQYLDGLSNGVESIVGGIESPQAVWQALLDSPAHRPHLLGDGPGFSEQNEFGIAYRQNIYAPHVDYWVIVIARQQMPEDPSLICTPAPAVCFPVGVSETQPLRDR